MTTSSFAIGNMHCPSCALQIERVLERIDGVRAVRVNATTRRMRLDWDDTKIGMEHLLERVENLGFSVKPFDAGETEDHARTEQRQLLQYLAVAAFGACNVMMMSIAIWIGGAEDMASGSRRILHGFSALVAIPTVLYAGIPFFKAAASALRSRSTNMDVPVSVAILLATGASLIAAAQNGHHVYFDAPVALLFFLLLGRYLDASLRSRTASSAQNLLALRGEIARVVDVSGRETMTPVGTLGPGMRVRVLPNEGIPADGIVRTGRTDIDVSLLTGETLPRSVEDGDRVYAGARNLTAPLMIEVSTATEDSLIEQIAAATEKGMLGRGHYLRFADRVARAYTPAVHLLAAAAFVLWYWVLGEGWWTSLMISVAVLIVTCPCALSLAVPAVQIGAIQRLFRAGILVKTGDALERAADVGLVVFDKTGTLTTGKLSLLNADQINDPDLSLASRICRNSTHPLARAISDAAPSGKAEGVVEHPGQGLELLSDGTPIRVGSRKFIGMPPEAGDRSPGPELWLRRGAGDPVRFLFSDRVRSDAAETVAALRDDGITVILASGDRTESVAAAARSAGIPEFHAALLPVDKVRLIDRRLAAHGQKGMMVGDGLNDAPALAGSHVSMAPAMALDAAQMSADIIFQGDRLAPVRQVIGVARKAMALVHQNLLISLCYNLIAVPVAFSGQITPFLAAIFMSASSLTVTLNSLRIAREG